MEGRATIPEYIVFETKKQYSKSNEYRVFIVPAHKCIIKGTGLVAYELVKTGERHMEMSVEEIEQVEKRIDLMLDIDGKEYQVNRFTVVATVFDALSKFRAWSADVMKEQRIDDNDRE